MIRFIATFASAMVLSGCLATGAPLGSTVEDLASLKSHNQTVVTAEQGPVKAGKLSQRFELRKGECRAEDCWTDRERTEKTTSIEMPYGSDNWLSWYFYVPEDATYPKYISTTVGQIYGWNKAPNWRPLAMVMISGNVVQTQWIQSSLLRDNSGENGSRYASNGFVEWAGKLSDLRGKWNQVVIHVDTTLDAGILQIYLNGKLVNEVKNPVQATGFQHFGFKYGLYRSFISQEKGPMPTSVIYYDEMRFGHTREEVDDILNPSLPVVD